MPAVSSANPEPTEGGTSRTGEPTAAGAEALSRPPRMAGRRLCRFPPRHSSAATTAHQTLYLGVFLLLLAFFAVIVSKSDLAEDRVAMVLSSIHAKFDTQGAVIPRLAVGPRTSGTDELPQATRLRSFLEAYSVHTAHGRSTRQSIVSGSTRA